MIRECWKPDLLYTLRRVEQSGPLAHLVEHFHGMEGVAGSNPAWSTNNRMLSEKRQITVVIGLIKNKKGEILLQKRIDPLIPAAHDKWEFPGGRIDFGESPEEALIRETHEEVGCDIRIQRLMPLVQSPVWERTDGKIQQVFVVCYEAKYLDGELKSDDPKVAEIAWFSKGEALRLDLLKGIREFIELTQ